MKTQRKSSSTLLTYLYLIAALWLVGYSAKAQENTQKIRLIAPEVVAQGQTFTGTIGEETDSGFIPLRKGSQIQVMGTVVEVGDQGKVEIPGCPKASDILPLKAQLISVPGRATSGSTPITSTPPTFIPVSNTPVPSTEIWNTPDIIGPGELITIQGTNVDQLTHEMLQSTSGVNVPLTEVSSSYFESQYLVTGELPEGSYHFSAQDPDGNIHTADNVSVNPTLTMEGPALKNVGQKGKIVLQANVDGIILLSGGPPVIQIQPNGDVIPSLGRDQFQIVVKAGKTIKVPFRARQVGQYLVTARMYGEGELPVEFNSGSASVEETTVEANYDIVSRETTITTKVDLVSESGTPLHETKVEGVLSHPNGVEYITATTNEAGTLRMDTTVSGEVSRDLISFYPLQIVGYNLANVQNGNPKDCNDDKPNGEIDEALVEELAKMLEEQQSIWGNYGGICGTGLLEIARSDPQAFANNMDAKQQIRSWLQELLHTSQDQAEDVNFDEALRDIYKANKKKWGNYSGVCGSGLLEWARQDPKGYAEFLKFEEQITQWMESIDTNENEEAEIDEDLRKIYEANKEIWGNYQGICGTALLEMARLYPKLYAKFLENERRIEESLKEKPSKPENADKDDDGIEDGEEAEIQEKIENPDAPEFKDERITRAFESDHVEPYRTITIRLGGVEAGITKVGDHYFMTEIKSTATDPETGQVVSFFDFTKGEVIEGELWYPIYLISLTKSPLNLISRIVDSAESLGKSYIDALMADMRDNDNPAIIIDIPSDVLLLMQFTVSFEMAAMPQLGDHVRSAQAHFEKALAAAQRGDWMEAWIELNNAEMDMAFMLLELWPGGSSGKGVVKGGRTLSKPLVEASTVTGRKLDEVLDALRTAAKNETNTDIANTISKKADDLQDMASQSSRVRRAFDIGPPRPTNMATAAKDRKSLEEFFGAENVSRLGRRRENNVLVITAKAPDGSDVKQVWVRPDYTDYKKAYTDVHGEIPVGMDIDHVQSRTRAGQQGYGYVLVMAVDSKSNRTWGSTMEKATVQMGRAGHVERSLPGIRMIDQLQWWKLCRITPDVIKERLLQNLNKAKNK